MFDKIAMILISVFVPILILSGIKVYNTKNYRKLIIGLTIAFLGVELFRFFYNASLYPMAVTPSNSLTFCYLSFMCATSLFATFNTSKIGEIAKRVLKFTILLPIIMAFIDPKLYTFEFDTYAVIKALYFIEIGLNITLAILYQLEDNRFCKEEILYPIIFFILYIGINALSIVYFKTGVNFDGIYTIKMILCLISIFIVWSINFLIYKKKLKNE